jgi:hypothetical protein
MAPHRAITLVAVAGLAVLGAAGIRAALAQGEPPPNVPPYVISPYPGIFDTLPGPSTDPRYYSRSDIVVPSAPPPAPIVLDASGTVGEIAEDEIVVDRAGQGAISIDLGPRTFVYLDGEPASWRELPEGASVKVDYDLRGNDRVARRVDVTSGSHPPRR